MKTTKAILLCVLFATSFACHAFFKVDFSLEDDFSDSSVRRGISATREKCNLIPEKAVWSRVGLEIAECIKFWSSGLTHNTGRAIVFFHGDVIPIRPSYSKMTGDRLNKISIGWSQKLRAPFIYMGRPGTLGSSGSHSRRRLLEEGQIISAALDGLKIKYGINEFVVAGQSGGGHLTASLLTLRNDIVCAVPTSAPSSPRIRFLKMGRTIDTTNLPSYEPFENFTNPVHKDLRVVVLGDPMDSNVFWESQTALVEPLKKRGIPHLILEGQGSDPSRHELSNSSRDIAGMCFHNKSFEEMKSHELKLRG